MYRRDKYRQMGVERIDSNADCVFVEARFLMSIKLRAGWTCELNAVGWEGSTSTTWTRSEIADSVRKKTQLTWGNAYTWASLVVRTWGEHTFGERKEALKTVFMVLVACTRMREAWMHEEVCCYERMQVLRKCVLGTRRSAYIQVPAV